MIQFSLLKIDLAIQGFVALYEFKIIFYFCETLHLTFDRVFKYIDYFR